MVAYGLDLGRIDKRALHTVEGAVMREQHVAAPYQLVCTGAVEDCFRVDHLRYAECDTAWEVGLDNAGDYVGRRALGCDKTGVASTSSLQRRYSIGYNRAGKIMDQLEAAGIVGPSQGGKPRQVLIDQMQLGSIIRSFE